MRKVIYIFCIFIVSSCNIIKNSNNGIVGFYYCQPFEQLKSDSLFLRINIDRTYSYIPKFVNLSGPINFCDSSRGKWKIRNNNLNLNSKSFEFDRHNILFRNEKNSSKDSIFLRVINYSNKTPYIGYTISLINEKDSFCIFITDNNGEFKIPNKWHSKLDLTDHVGQGKWIKRLNKKYNYTFIYFDCYPEIFKNEKYKICGDTLIRTIKGTKGKYLEKYIKIKSDNS